MGRASLIIKATKLPPGPEENKPIVGKLYSIYHGDFVFFAKWPQHSWTREEHSSKSLEEIRDLIRSVPYAMLTKISINEDVGSLRGSLLVGKKTIDFWLQCKENETCLDVWQTYFISACV